MRSRIYYSLIRPELSRLVMLQSLRSQTATDGRCVEVTLTAGAYNKMQRVFGVSW